MDISTWTEAEILQLPDHVFGKRWQIITHYNVNKAASAIWLHNELLPDRFVLWNAFIRISYQDNHDSWFKMALSADLPANEAAFDLCTRIFPGTFASNKEEGAFFVHSTAEFVIPCRTIFDGTDKYLCYELKNSSATYTTYVQAILTISNVPTEIQQWLI